MGVSSAVINITKTFKNASLETSYFTKMFSLKCFSFTYMKVPFPKNCKKSRYLLFIFLSQCYYYLHILYNLVVYFNIYNTLIIY